MSTVIVVGGAELGWRPRLGDLQAIVDTAWRWHRTHPKGYAGARLPE